MATPTVSVSDFVNRKFDFLIIGGGTAGLAVAARLSECHELTIGVLEAGPAAFGEDEINVPGFFGRALGGKYDWQFETVPQPGLGGRRLKWARGKVLGGSSALNFMTWNRPSRQDYDAWERLGNSGWGWDALLLVSSRRWPAAIRAAKLISSRPYFKKSETFHAPSREHQEQHKALLNCDAMGSDGPIQVMYTKDLSASHKFWHDTLNSLGVQTNSAHLSGSNVGVWTNVCSVNPRTGTRSYAATTYYAQAASRSNLAVLTEALVTEIVLDKEDGTWLAKGVRFQHGGKVYNVAASREVILSAGSIQSPQLLELSGIGSPEVLSAAGVAVKVANSNVGENLQDHLSKYGTLEVRVVILTSWQCCPWWSRSTRRCPRLRISTAMQSSQQQRTRST
jgi:choline dehydrogenase-like flavoprotein